MNMMVLSLTMMIVGRIVDTPPWKMNTKVVVTITMVKPDEKMIPGVVVAAVPVLEVLVRTIPTFITRRMVIMMIRPHQTRMDHTIRS
jgi:hypothetical protein